MCKTSGRLSWHPGWVHPAVWLRLCSACNTVVTVSEQNRAEQREGICVCARFVCVHMLKRVCECECASVCIHVWLNTAGHQQLWQASAVERDECCHSQVTPDHSQNDLLSSHVPLFLIPSLPSQSHMEVQLAAGLDWAWKHTSVQWPLDCFYRGAHERTVCTSFMIPTHIFLWMPDKHPPSASLAPSWNTRETEVRLEKRQNTKQPGGNG